MKRYKRHSEGDLKLKEALFIVWYYKLNTGLYNWLTSANTDTSIICTVYVVVTMGMNTKYKFRDKLYMFAICTCNSIIKNMFRTYVYCSTQELIFTNRILLHITNTKRTVFFDSHVICNDVSISTSL